MFNCVVRSIDASSIILTQLSSIQHSFSSAKSKNGENTIIIKWTHFAYGKHDIDLYTNSKKICVYINKYLWDFIYTCECVCDAKKAEQIAWCVLKKQQKRKHVVSFPLFHDSFSPFIRLIFLPLLLTHTLLSNRTNFQTLHLNMNNIINAMNWFEMSELKINSLNFFFLICATVGWRRCWWGFFLCLDRKPISI